MIIKKYLYVYIKQTDLATEVKIIYIVADDQITQDKILNKKISSS